MKAKKPCTQRGCAELTSGRYCNTHAKAVMRDYNRYHRDPESNKRYGSRWKAVRDTFIAANPLCAVCQHEGRLIPAVLVHHKRPLADGGTNNHDNLMSLCVG